MTLRFPDAPGTTRSLDDCNRAIKFIQSARVLTVPSLDALPDTGEMGQLAIVNDGTVTLWWWGGSWTQISTSSGGSSGSSGGIDGGGP